MRLVRIVRAILVCLGWLGLTLPLGTLYADTPMTMTATQPRQTQAKLLSDVELHPKGTLHGLVVDVQGVPVTHALVVIHQIDRELARTSTDPFGRFSVSGLRGGTYRIAVGRQAQLVRAWTARTAPPGATQLTMVVVGSSVVRGQWPMERLFGSDCFVVAAMVAAAIAIPVAIHNSKGKSTPGSP